MHTRRQEKEPTMTFARVYQMIAADGKEQALLDALIALERVVRPLDGCLGVELLRDSMQSNKFLFVEKWRTVEAHKAAGASLPRASFGQVVEALAKPPEGSYQEYVIGG
jgi:quinol monooxygenase YgiN